MPSFRDRNENKKLGPRSTFLFLFRNNLLAIIIIILAVACTAAAAAAAPVNEVVRRHRSTVRKYRKDVRRGQERKVPLAGNNLHDDDGDGGTRRGDETKQSVTLSCGTAESGARQQEAAAEKHEIRTPSSSKVCETNDNKNNNNGRENDDDDDDDDDDAVNVCTNDRRMKKIEDPNTHECRLYLAKSTIPNAGLGVYTSVDLSRGEMIRFNNHHHDDDDGISSGGGGDAVIPILDIPHFHPNTIQGWNHFWPLFVWEEYYWNAVVLGMDFQNEVEEEETRDSDDDDDDYTDHNIIYGASPGTASLANGFPGLDNIKLNPPLYDAGGGGVDFLSQEVRTDPGAGASTPYHNRTAWAIRDIAAGSELFVNYGRDWFEKRVEKLGLIPLEYDYDDAEDLIEAFMESTDGHVVKDKVRRDLWNLISANFPFESRTLNALPDSHDDIKEILKVGISERLRLRTIRSVEWLKNNGKCMDNIRSGISTISHAGKGAFATRHIAKGDVVAPAPLIHMPDGSILDVKNDKLKFPTGMHPLNDTTPTGKQLLLNYCFSHPDSTLLLCPYGAMTSYINHNSNTPNVEIRWADDGTINHNASWFDLSVHDLRRQRQGPGLAFEYIALRDIHPNEEILVDYGKEWEEAWYQHVQGWEPPNEMQKYVRASVLNADIQNNATFVLRTEQEQKNNPYPPNVELHCHEEFLNWVNHVHQPKIRRVHSGGINRNTKRGWHPCKVVSREDMNGTIRYNVTMEVKKTTPTSSSFEQNQKPPSWSSTTLSTNTHHQLSGIYKLNNIPHEAFMFMDRPYTSEWQAIRNAFRHSMMIPDDMFPVSWRNKK